MSIMRCDYCGHRWDSDTEDNDCRYSTTHWLLFKLMCEKCVERYELGCPVEAFNVGDAQ
jgi:hypothetical protein